MSSPGASHIGSLAAGGRPATPSLPIDTLIEQLVSGVPAARVVQDRLHHFHEASRALMAELEPDLLMQRALDLIRQVAGARHGVLEVRAADGQAARLLHSDEDPDRPSPTVLQLRRLMVQREPVVPPGATTDPQACGLPPEHPATGSFLAVPVSSGARVHAVAYLADRTGGRAFGDDDVELAEALAVTAAVSLDNARLYQESRRRQEWLRAAAGLGSYLLGSSDPRRVVLRHTVGVAKGLLQADAVLLLDPVDFGEQLEVVVAEGRGRTSLLGLRLPHQGSVAGRCLDSGQVVRVEAGAVADGPDAALLALLPTGFLVALPLLDDAGSQGVVLATRRPGQPPFTRSETEMALTFAGQASAAIRLAESRTARHRLSGMEQRDQIARDLHTQVVQRLFAIAMSLQGTLDRVREPAVRQRLGRTVDDVDETIRQIRTSIFTVTSASAANLTVADTARSVIGQLTPMLGFEPELQLRGPLDWAANTPLTRDIEAVLRESLTNVGKYAEAGLARVLVETDGSRLVLTVADDGVGMRGSTRRSGLDNLRRRAERYGGQLDIDIATEGGLRLQWAIPL